MEQLEILLKEAKFTPCRGWGGKRTELTTDGKVPKILFFYENSNASKKYPEIHDILKQLSIDLFPDHEYDVVQINNNVSMKPHLDAKNNGDTILFTLGEFTGGGVFIENLLYDCYKNPRKFCGSKQIHSSEEFEGDRYSIIYYQNKSLRNRLRHQSNK
jgi:hypothetical protein